MLRFSLHSLMSTVRARAQACIPSRTAHSPVAASLALMLTLLLAALCVNAQAQPAPGAPPPDAAHDGAQDAAAGAASDAASQTAPPALVLHVGTLLADPGTPPLHERTVVVREGVIVAVEPGYRAPADYGAEARAIDLRDRFVMPGLIDLHMHLAIMMNAGQDVVGSPPRLALASAAYAQRLLQAGVTTVRDVGDNTGVVLALRDAIAAGDTDGPRIFAAGRVISRTGGHGARRAAPGDIPYTPAACDGVESCRRAVRENVESGADWIKLTVSGSARESGGDPAAEPDLFPDEIAAAGAAAAQAHRPLAAHAYNPRAIDAALEAGARTIEHGSFFDAGSARLFLRRNAWLVPTASVAAFVRERLDMFADGPGAQSADGLRAWTDAALSAPGRAWRAGIPLALGTDGGPSFPPENTAGEVALYVASGVPVAEALASATRHNAEALGQGGHLGRLQTGYAADLIALDGDPLDDVTALRRVVFVMQGGRIHRDDDGRDRPQRTPEH